MSSAHWDETGIKTGACSEFSGGAMTQKEPDTPEEKQGSFWMNIGKIAFLIAVLTAAWFVLERLIGQK